MIALNKFAGLHHIANEAPEAMATALDTIEDNLRQQLNNISIMKERFNITEPVGEVKEGEAAEVKPVEGEQRLAGFKHFASEAPEAIEEAFGELYLGLDEIMSQVENLADNCDVTLPDSATEDAPEGAADGEPASEEPSKEETEETADEEKA